MSSFHRFYTTGSPIPSCHGLPFEIDAGYTSCHGGSYQPIKIEAEPLYPSESSAETETMTGDLVAQGITLAELDVSKTLKKLFFL